MLNIGTPLDIIHKQIINHYTPTDRRTSNYWEEETSCVQLLQYYSCAYYYCTWYWRHLKLQLWLIHNTHDSNCYFQNIPSPFYYHWLRNCEATQNVYKHYSSTKDIGYYNLITTALHLATSLRPFHHCARNYWTATTLRMVRYLTATEALRLWLLHQQMCSKQHNLTHQSATS